MSGAPPRRVVIDPNVFVSATITPAGGLGPLIGLIDDGTLVPVVTQHLVDEVVDVLGRPKLAKYVKPGVGAAFAQQMRQLGEWHADIVDPPSVTRDRGDDYLVALAQAARADAIASGDDDLHAAMPFGVDVLTPRELLTRLGL
ncbi:putative toxin-antitoxin system toxin component, PIN family [Nocardioides sp. GXZ039]|uniref:putative toxin-antitoxin system toxin component, PIN family n=1 Tax=Nocardioides sp. GXZ039 TaxID=3136018 RepID=UPI0030F3AE37